MTVLLCQWFAEGFFVEGFVAYQPGKDYKTISNQFGVKKKKKKEKRKKSEPLLASLNMLNFKVGHSTIKSLVCLQRLPQENLFCLNKHGSTTELHKTVSDQTTRFLEQCPMDR